jgi:hypothetical protein
MRWQNLNGETMFQLGLPALLIITLVLLIASIAITSLPQLASIQEATPKTHKPRK